MKSKTAAFLLSATFTLGLAGSAMAAPQFTTNRTEVRTVAYNNNSAQLRQVRRNIRTTQMQLNAARARHDRNATRIASRRLSKLQMQERSLMGHR